MAKMGGMELLRLIKLSYPMLPVIMMTGYPRVEVAVEAMKDGAIVCNSGHFDVEVNKEDLDAITVEKFQTRPFVEGHRTKAQNDEGSEGQEAERRARDDEPDVEGHRFKA